MFGLTLTAKTIAGMTQQRPHDPNMHQKKAKMIERVKKLSLGY